MDRTDDFVENNYMYNDGSCDEEKEDGLRNEDNGFCTLAVTGADPTFQAIFLCNECFLEDSSPRATNAIDGPANTTTILAPNSQSPLCICQACAEYCHNDEDGYHDVEYIGMGPSYCDCSRLGNCKLYEKSLREAERLGMAAPQESRRQEEEGIVASPPPSTESSTDFIREAFDISILQQQKQQVEGTGIKPELASLLVEQARELIRHTKETHWIDETLIGGKMESQGDAPPSPKKLCLLEHLAWSIYCSHRERYKNELFCEDDTTTNDGIPQTGGAEWWVQVKNISTRNMPEDDTPHGATDTLPSSSIDLHYDKDEALAESFGIGSFPALSTVTYLTAAPTIAAPTIVFDHTYTQGEDEVMSSMMVSRPRVGKHICFDGRLLHGAPYHPALLASSGVVDDHKGGDSVNEPSSSSSLVRVTFLVNLWKDRRPANVHALDDAIRESILSLQSLEGISSSEEETATAPLFVGQPLPMTPLAIPKVSLEAEDDLPKHLQDRIELPFVSNLGEEDDEEEDAGDNEPQEGSTVVVTFPPPPTKDCVLVQFGPGMQAYMDYNYGPEQDESDADSNVAQADDESTHSRTRIATPKSQSAYV